MCATRFSSNQEPERRIHLSLHVFQDCGKKTKVGLLLLVFLVTQPVPLTFINLHRFDGESFDISLKKKSSHKHLKQIRPVLQDHLRLHGSQLNLIAQLN